MALAAISTDNKLGVNLQVTQNYSAAVPEYPGINFNLGETVLGRDGSKYVFAIAPVAVPLGGAVYFDNNWNANLLTTASAGTTSGQKVGIASQTPFAANDRGWFQIDGLVQAVAVAANTTANSQLYTSAVPGVLTSTASGNVAVNGVITTTLNGAAQAVQPGVMNNPEILLTT